MSKTANATIRVQKMED